MGWLAPALLAGLGALAIPIVLHLLKRERRQVVEFPSLMFLRQIPQETTRRRRLRHPLLLVLRCLALALIAIAFARPFLRDRLAALPVGDQSRDVVILLDRSYSMGHADRWARAMAAAGQVVDDLGGQDRATLVLFDDRAEATGEPTGDRAVVRSLLSAARPGSGATRYAPALRLARELLVEGGRPLGEVVLVSDFQRGGWDGGPDDLRFPSGTVLRRVDVASGPTPADVAVAGVELARSGEEGRELLAVSAELRAMPPLARDGLPGGEVPAGGVRETIARRATLELNGRALQTVTVEVPAGGSVSARFEPQALPPGMVRGLVRLDDAGGSDALAANDTARFVASRPRTLDVLLVHPGREGARGTLHLERALSLARDPAYAITRRSAGELAPADLDGRSLVILHDTALPDGESGRRLAAHLRAGGGLLVAMGERSRRARWGGPVAELAPLELGAVRDRDVAGGAAGSVGSVDRTHVLFAPFLQTRGDVLGARVLRYRELRPDTGARVLASFDDGAPALVEHDAGRGRLLAWATSLDDSWTDFPVQPAFLPFVHELVRYASGGTPSVPWVTVGARVDVAAYTRDLAGSGGAIGGRRGAPEGTAERWLAIAPSGARTTLSTGDMLEPREAGIYELRAMDASGAEVPVPLAVNVAPGEADLTQLDSAALGGVTTGTDGAAILAGEQAAAGVPVGVGTLTDAERESRQGLWWPLLALASLVLAGEPLLANRLSRLTR